ncbi:HD-GYP domain-containing protein [Magnetofaba australis]|uniref:Putative metal dependent phosphohydrolase n=1 Tax=Magnetofaba australis IT-1 TaxID=1434232 RepID=A0A1Y2K1X5_9PROT|nr:HD domain-containing phosphohydrolase [Magnetofaba australis]OSM02013.1 putative metal dependent phosphohydrolase [Magnetofaba australis IT-1]
MQKPSIKTITLKKLTGLAFLFVLAMLMLIAFNFRSLIIEAMKDKAVTLAQSVEVGITSHMLESHKSNRKQMIERISAFNRVTDLNIIRSRVVNEQFGLLDQRIALADPVVQRVMQVGIPVFEEPSAVLSLLPIPGQQRTMRVYYPYRARSTDGIDCLSCHEAQSGQVLGVLDFQVDLANYLELSIGYLWMLMGLLSLSLLVITWFLFRVIDSTIKDPLHWLIRRTHASYQKHIPIDLSQFEAMELDYFAAKVNEFNELVLKQNAELIAMNKEIEATQREIILTMGYVGETRSLETALHVTRVAQIAHLLACKSGLSTHDCQLILNATPMHDIGKVGIADAVLKKAGPLTDVERRAMQQHAEWGKKIFQNCKQPLMRAAGIIAHQHHERWDGQGYPRGLHGEEIHIYGRIVAIADVFDALLSRRCYKEPWPLPKVFDYFTGESGKQFDPHLIVTLLAARVELEALINQDETP